MTVEELEYLRSKSVQIFEDLPGKELFRSEVSYLESPNPSCLFEIDGAFFLQGRFWSNKEYAIEAISNKSDIGLIESRGVIQDLPGAIRVMMEFKDRIMSLSR